MRRDLSIKSGNLAGTSDFRVVAKIKPGLVPSLDSMTYKTRVKRVLRTLHAGRAGGFEYEFARILSDAVERVGVIHSVGIAVLEPEDTVLLTVTFDGAWESYVRVIWQKVARLLDLVFCNTENYVNGYESSYEKWGAWLKNAQSEAYFLYATPALTVDDTRYLKTQERVQRREAGAAAERRITHIRIPTAEDIARQSLFGKGGPVGTDPANAGFGEPLTKQEAGVPPFRHGVKSLVGLYRLADVYLPGTDDGEILNRAAQELLPEFRQMLGDGVYQTGIVRATKRFQEAVLWLLKPPPPEPEPRRGLPLQPPDEPPLQDARNVQGGILSAYENVDHGCLLLLGFEKPAAVAALLKVLPFTSEADPLHPDQIATNIAFTSEGLRAAGMSDDEMRKLPDEFVQGMERRAGLLGDLRVNHPRRWRLPALNWHLGADAPDIGEDDPTPRIDLSSVHAVIQVRLQAPNADMAKSRAQLMAAMRKLVADSPGVKPLSLQWMQRLRTDDGQVKEHFGFLDGTSNPVFRKSDAGVRYPNHVNLGEILCGYPNLADKTARYADAPEFIRSLLQDGSFLAVRKLRQDVDALEQALSAAQADATAAGLAVTREDFMAKMMGRWPGDHPTKAGQPLAVVPNPGPRSNDFHFETDKDGALCPFHAHIRRANPRVRNPEAGSRPPRFVRRGMSYGPPRQPDSNGAYSSESPAQERGLIFMAYNANLGEQYELVQSWLNGGNSSGSFSGQTDPIFGIAEPGRRRYFSFEQDGKTVRMGLDGSDRLHEEPRPFVRLEWGAYLFAPSKRALASLQARAAAQSYKRTVTWSADVGEKEIARLREFEAHASPEQAIEAWKTTLEDPVAASDFTTASVWAAIRERHGGVLKTPFGVLVAERSLVEQVLLDPSGNLSVKGYLPRMHDSFGEIYLGLDDGPDGTYSRDSAACNDAIMNLNLQDTFQKAKQSTQAALQALVNEAKGYAQRDGDTAWDLTVDARELIDPMLTVFCEEWFGLSEAGNCFRRGSFRWDWQPGQPPLYPGHFLAPSRYFFQARPGKPAEDFGKKHGVAARTAMHALLSGPGAQTKAPVARAVLNSIPGQDFDFAARTIVGAVIGFVPTVSGNLLQILNEWLREGTLWSLRARYGDNAAADDFTDACNRLRDAFIPAMQLRPVPPTIWRTAVASHTLGAGAHQVDVTPGDIVVVGATSATQQNLQQGRPELHHAFGGNRRAKPHPTHACPGADPALAVMIGFFSALVESELPLRAGPGPLTIALDGRIPGPDEIFKAKLLATVSIDPAYDSKFEVGNKLRRGATATPLLAVGDSWLFDQWDRDFGVTRPNLTKSLRALGYTDIASSTTDFAYAGRTLSQMADEFFLREVTNFIADQPDIKALIVGGGGNDVVAGYPGRQPLFKMLRPRSAGAPALIEAEVSSFIDGTLFNYYNTILTALTASTSVPIILHAYDHPIPDGRGDSIRGIEIGPWLYPYFLGAGYKIHPFPDGSPDLELGKEVMKQLIDRLNAMVTRVAAAYPNVHHVNLTGTLARAYGTDYARLWNNELHSKGDGFDLLGKLIETKLISLGVLGNPKILASK